MDASFSWFGICRSRLWDKDLSVSNSLGKWSQETAVANGEMSQGREEAKERCINKEVMTTVGNQSLILLENRRASVGHTPESCHPSHNGAGYWTNPSCQPVGSGLHPGGIRSPTLPAQPSHRQREVLQPGNDHRWRIMGAGCWKLI